MGYEGERCINEEQEKCEKKWITVGYSKVWEIDPTTCVKVKETKCYKETKYKKVPKKKCTIKSIQKEKCVEKYAPECKENTYQNCVQVHKQVPKQVSYKKPVKKCDVKY